MPNTAEILFLQRFYRMQGLYMGALDGISGPQTEAAAEAFDFHRQRLAEELGPFDPRSERHILALALPAQQRARRFMALLREAGLDARIISGLRSYAEQEQLYRQGRWGNPGPVVTQARAGYSLHNFGIAWDIGLFSPSGAYLSSGPLYAAAAEAGLAAGGLEWGGHWAKFPDLPHYQLSLGMGVAQIRERFERGDIFAPWPPLPDSLMALFAAEPAGEGCGCVHP
jgi:peptidoglycan L-alanyl-D-glutamate endopeptidase CwlK